MGLMDSLRKAEEQGKSAARRGMELARGGWEDAERRIRRKMRIYPAQFLRAHRQAAAQSPGPVRPMESPRDTRETSTPPDVRKGAA